MPLTRAGIENEIVTAFSGILVNRFFTMSILTNGSNPDLNAPIRIALRSLGVNTADPLIVADADLVSYTGGWEVERLIDAVKLETLRLCLVRCPLIDIQVGEDKYMISQFRAQLMAEILAAEQRLIAGLNMSPAILSPMTGHSMPNDPFDPYRTRSACGNWPYP